MVPRCLMMSTHVKANKKKKKKAGQPTSDLLLLLFLLLFLILFSLLLLFSSDVEAVKNGCGETPTVKTKQRMTKKVEESEGGREGGGRGDCTQNNASESLAEAQSCSEREPLTKPPEPGQPSLTNEKPLVEGRTGEGGGAGGRWVGGRGWSREKGHRQD